MKLPYLFLSIILSLLAGCSRNYIPAPAPKGGYSEVGNGGDYIRLLFEQGRFQGASIVERVRREFFPSNISDYLREGELDWIFSHQPEIIHDINSTRFIWIDKLPADCPANECACSPSNGVVLFAQNQCEARITTVRQAAYLIIHESMHHFVGNDEGKAKRLGVAIQVAWMNMGHPESPHWKIITPPLGDSNYDRNPENWTHSVWTGKKLRVWNEATMLEYDPIADSWSSTDVASFKGVTGYEGGINWKDIGRFWSDKVAEDFWVDGKIVMFLFKASWAKNFDETTRTWSSVPGTRSFDEATKRWVAAPLSPIEDQIWNVISTGNNLTAWGGPYSEGMSESNRGAIFDPASEKWTEMIREGAPSSRSIPSLTWTGDKLIVWGGYDVYRRALNSGGIYDPAKGTWEPIPEDGAPSPRYKHVAIWTGSELFVFGGENENRGIGPQLNTGGAYDPKLKKWRSIKSGPAIQAFSPAIAVWAGLNMIVKGNNELYFYDPFHDQWSPQGRIGLPPRFSSEGLFWTGMELISWDSKMNTGYLFYP